MEFGGRATLAKAFTILEQCNRALCQHNPTDLVSLLMDSNKSRKAPVVTVVLAEAKVEKTLYCWFCGQAGHAKKDCPSKQRQAQTIGNPKRKPIVIAKDSTKGANNNLSKQLRCSHCGRNNHAVENCFAFHPKKCLSSICEKMLEAKIRALEERFKSLASSNQILDSPSSSGA